MAGIGAPLTVQKLVVVLMMLGGLSACRSDKALVGDHPPELVGTWQLLIRSSCRDYGLNADVLVLHADGTFDQNVTLSNGKQFHLGAQSWEYSNGHIALDKRLEFFIPEHFAKSGGDSGAILEDLIVEYKSEPVIVLHPDSDCVYAKERVHR